MTAADIRACGITFENMDALDLKPIAARAAALQRHAGTTDYASKVIADNIALLAEVERLRARLLESR